MIAKIKQFFDQYIVIPEDSDDEAREHQLRLASAALMIEVLYADHSFGTRELDTLREALQEHFELSLEDANRLIRLADEERVEATDYYQFTSLINEFYTQQQKRELITRLWQMAYADNKVHKFEEHLIRRLADLLHVPHAAFMQSKHRAAAQPGKK